MQEGHFSSTDGGPGRREITLPREEDRLGVDFAQALKYVNKVKARFQTNESIYKAFLEILTMYRKGDKSISEVYQDVTTLFEGHDDLVEEFTTFLPSSTGRPATAPAQPVAIEPVHTIRIP